MDNILSEQFVSDFDFEMIYNEFLTAGFDATLNYENKIAPALKSPWKMIVGANLDEENFYIIAQFDDYIPIRVSFDAVITQMQPDLNHYFENEVEYWVEEYDDFFCLPSRRYFCD